MGKSRFGICVFCKKIALFGNGEIKTHCYIHRTPDMVKKNYLCNVDFCKNVGKYGYDGGKNKYCANHCSQSMVCICQAKLCANKALYCKPNQTIPTFCLNHVRPGYICIEMGEKDPLNDIKALDIEDYRKLYPGNYDLEDTTDEE